MRLVFTGPSGAFDESALADFLDTHPSDEYISGCAYGFDSRAALMAFTRYPRARHVLYVPAARHNGGIVEWGEAVGAEIIACQPGRNAPASYMIRNQTMVGRGDAICAGLHALKFYRSGEWATLNRARRAGLREFLLLV